MILASLCVMAQTGNASTPVMPPLIQEFSADRQDVMAAYGLPGAPIQFDHLSALYTHWLKRLEALPFGTLPQPEKVDYILLRNEVEAGLDDVAFDRIRWSELAPLLPFRAAIYSLEQARWNGDPLNSQAAATAISQLAKQATAVRDSLTTTATNTPSPFSPALALRAANATDQLRDTLKDWFTFHDGYRPDFSWWVKPPYEDADKALEAYAKKLREDVAGLKGKDEDPLVGQPVGEAALASAIRHEFLPYNAAALLAIGEHEMAWCDREMKKAAQDMGFGEDWKAALAKVKADFVDPGGQDTLINALSQEALAFTREHHLATVPPACGETLRLTMMPPKTQKTIPYAAYNGQAMMVAYPRNDMAHDDKLMTMRGNNRHSMRTVTPHELIPGHHLQRFQAARHNPYRALFSTPFYVEGWALYGERRFWDLGWAQTPEDRLGMLFWRINRAARIVVSIKYHLGTMTTAGMVDFLVDRVGHERLGATSEVRRFISDSYRPHYQAAYTLGGLQIDTLRQEVVGRNLMTELEFNDAVLARGPIPIELIRAELLDLPLTRNTRPAWTFAPPPRAP